MNGRKILVAGIGNVFLGDDGFGVEVLARLMRRPAPKGVEWADFGIRGLDLAYALMEPYDVAILVDALPRGGAPGTVYLLEPDVDGLPAGELVDSHGMDPVRVLSMVNDMGGQPPKVLIVGCEPETFGPEDEGAMGLSATVEAAIDEAVALVESLLLEMTAKQEVG